MYFWKFEIVLKSGKTIIGYDKNDFDNSYDLAREYLKDKNNQFISLGNLNNTENIFVRVKDIAAMTLSVGNKEESGRL